MEFKPRSPATSVPAGVVEENVLEAVEVEQDISVGEEVIEKTPTAFDRDVV